MINENHTNSQKKSFDQINTRDEMNRLIKIKFQLRAF